MQQLDELQRVARAVRERALEHVRAADLEAHYHADHQAIRLLREENARLRAEVAFHQAEGEFWRARAMRAERRAS